MEILNLQVSYEAGETTPMEGVLLTVFVKEAVITYRNGKAVNTTDFYALIRENRFNCLTVVDLVRDPVTLLNLPKGSISG